VHLLHPKTLGYDGDPSTYLLPTNRFLVNFRRPLYDSPVSTVVMSSSDDESKVLCNHEFESPYLKNFYVMLVWCTVCEARRVRIL
jgi:hypothetical protein